MFAIASLKLHVSPISYFSWRYPAVDLQGASDAQIDLIPVSCEGVI